MSGIHGEYFSADQTDLLDVVEVQLAKRNVPDEIRRQIRAQIFDKRDRIRQGGDAIELRVPMQDLETIELSIKFHAGIAAVIQNRTSELSDSHSGEEKGADWQVLAVA